MSLAQIGEFAFVLLSRASNLHLVEVSAVILLLKKNINEMHEKNSPANHKSYCMISEILGAFGCGFSFLSLDLGSLAVVGLICEYRKSGLKTIVFGVQVYENYTLNE